MLLFLTLPLYFFFIKSKNKKAAALPFVLAAPLDSEKGRDDSILTITILNSKRFITLRLSTESRRQ